MASGLMGGRNLERLTVRLKRKRVLMGLAHSVWILTTSQNVAQGEESGKRICGVNRGEARESDQSRTNSTLGVSAGVAVHVNTGHGQLLAWPLGQESLELTTENILMPETRFEKQTLNFKNWKAPIHMMQVS